MRGKDGNAYRILKVSFRVATARECFACNSLQRSIFNERMSITWFAP